MAARRPFSIVSSMILIDDAKVQLFGSVVSDSFLSGMIRDDSFRYFPI